MVKKKKKVVPKKPDWALYMSKLEWMKYWEAASYLRALFSSKKITHCRITPFTKGSQAFVAEISTSKKSVWFVLHGYGRSPNAAIKNLCKNASILLQGF